MNDIVGPVATRRQTIEPVVVTRLICNTCEVEMTTSRIWVMGYTHKCPVCGVEETFEFGYPAFRQLTEHEWEELRHNQDHR